MVMEICWQMVESSGNMRSGPLTTAASVHLQNQPKKVANPSRSGFYTAWKAAEGWEGEESSSSILDLVYYTFCFFASIS